MIEIANAVFPLTFWITGECHNFFIANVPKAINYVPQIRTNAGLKHKVIFSQICRLF